jgi:hypothetical protein
LFPWNDPTSLTADDLWVQKLRPLTKFSWPSLKPQFLYTIGPTQRTNINFGKHLLFSKSSVCERAFFHCILYCHFMFWIKWNVWLHRPSDARLSTEDNWLTPDKDFVVVSTTSLSNKLMKTTEERICQHPIKRNHKERSYLWKNKIDLENSPTMSILFRKCFTHKGYFSKFSWKL